MALNQETLSIASIALAAFAGSFGHCIGMCGGFVSAYTTFKLDTKKYTPMHQFISHISYNIGRVSSYVLLGIIFGYIGQVFSFSQKSKGVLFLFIGILMIIMGMTLGGVGKIKFLKTLEKKTTSKYLPFFKFAFRGIINSKSRLSFYFLGALNGFLPCGFVYAFATMAAAFASPLKGALIMLVFGLSTIPALVSLGFMLGLFQRTKLRLFFLKITSLLIILFGAYMFYMGLGNIQGNMHMHMHMDMHGQ